VVVHVYVDAERGHLRKEIVTWVQAAALVPVVAAVLSARARGATSDDLPVLRGRGEPGVPAAMVTEIDVFERDKRLVTKPTRTAAQGGG
jgi:hypothetical protein